MKANPDECHFVSSFDKGIGITVKIPKIVSSIRGLNLTLKLSSILILITLFKKTLQVSIKSESQTKGLNFTNELNDSCALTVMCYNVSLLS